MTNMVIAFALFFLIGVGVMWLLKPSSDDNKPSGLGGTDPISGLGPDGFPHHDTSSTSHDGGGSEGGGSSH